MRSLFIYSILIISSLDCFSQEKSYTGQEKITKVMVYRGIAQISSQTTLNLEAGVANVTISNLPAAILSNSIEVSGEGDFTLLNVEPSVNYLKKPEKSKGYQLLEDSLNIYQDQLNEQLSKKFTLEQEQEILLSNKTITGKTDLVAEIEDLTVLYQTRLPAIKIEIYKIEKKINRISEQISNLKQEISIVSTEKTFASINISLNVNSNCNAKILLSYLVRNVGWKPIYDIRSKDIFSDLAISQKAEVFQNTGIDWENVSLQLSTGIPIVNGTLPKLNTLYTEYYNVNQFANRNDVQQDAQEINALPTRAITGTINKNNDQVSMQESQLAKVYEIKELISIASNQKKKIIALQSLTSKAKFNYLTIPKVNDNAYLLAKIPDWPALNLQSGNASVYFEGAFVGQTFIDALSTQDTLDMMLGIDKGINVKREKSKELTSSKIFGSSRTTLLSYTITLKNTKSVPISISVEDQLPTAKDKSIEILPVELSAARLDLETGKLTWDISLAPSESKKILFSYEVKYPKNKLVSGIE